jgi:hypothetical protein
MRAWVRTPYAHDESGCGRRQLKVIPRATNDNSLIGETHVICEVGTAIAVPLGVARGFIITVMPHNWCSGYLVMRQLGQLDALNSSRRSVTDA